MISFDEALARLVEIVRPLGTEAVALAAAHRRILAEPITARLSAPANDVSTMDGYAVRDLDIAQPPVTLKVAGESRPGSAYEGRIEPGECVRIFTGAPVPQGADRVVIQEIVRRDGGAAVFGEPGSAPLYIRRAGSDFREGDLLLAAGAELGPRQLVTAAAGDAAHLTVWRRPRIFVLGTGDELVQAGGASSRPGAVPDSISPGIVAMCEEWGGHFTGSRLLPDELPQLEAAAAVALEGADVVVVTGGASVGGRDFGKAMFAPQRLELIFAGVAMKPGKPVWFGTAKGKLVLGLPGNPTSAMVTARLFLAPLLRGLTGRDTALQWRAERLSVGLGPVGDRETFARATRSGGTLHLIGNQDSGAQAALAASELLVRLPAGSVGLPAAATVDVLDF